MLRKRMRDDMPDWEDFLARRRRETQLSPTFDPTN